MDNFLSTSIFALIAAVVLAAASAHATPATNLEVVTMPTVVVTGHRASAQVAAAGVVQMPMVVVTGHRQRSESTVVLASAE